MQGTLTVRCWTSFITSPRPRYGSLDYKCRPSSGYAHLLLQCLLQVRHSPSDCCSVYQECLSSSLAASCALSARHRTIPFSTLRIIVFGLGCRLNEGEERTREYPSSVLRDMAAQGGGAIRSVHCTRHSISLTFGFELLQL